MVLALSDSTGAADWPNREIVSAPTCQVDGFDGDKSHFTIYAGSGRSPLRWAMSPADQTLVFLAVGPGLPEAYDWYAASPRGGSMKVVHPTFYLVLVRERLRYVLRAYDGAPPAELLKADIQRAFRGELPLLAAYDPDGEAVTVMLPTQSNLHALLFADLPHRGKAATLRGPDGVFFAPTAGGVKLRGSGFVCPQKLAAFELRDMEVVASNDRDLDLMCRLFGRDGWISIFVTRYDAAPSTASVYQDYLSAMLKSAPPKRDEPEIVALDGPTKPPFGASWFDSKGQGQGMWLSRHGRYYIQVRSTFQDAVETAAIVNTIYKAAADQVPDQDDHP